MATTSDPSPVSSEERIPLLDALRGLALCGILVMNIKAFSGFEYTRLAFPDADARLGSGTRAAEWLTTVLADGKFYSIFSFLFGLGFALQLARGQGRPGSLGVYRRRLRILMVMGLAHAFLVWYGDILRVYATMGLVLLLFRNFSPKATLACGFGFLLAPVPFYTACWLYAPGYNTDDWIASPLTLEQVVALYQTASYPTALGLNLEDWQFRFKELFFSGRYFRVLGMFLLGLWAGRQGVLHAPERHRRLLQRVLIAGLVVGLVGGLARTLLPSSFRLEAVNIADRAVYAVAVHPLALAYVAGFALLWQRTAARRILSGLAPMGRMALTNYLVQSVLGVSIFYGYGFAWYGRMPTLVVYLALVPSILLMQALLSAWWLRRFRYGPMEWLWRRATYGRALPLRIASAHGLREQVA
jgi:uncharacterized protein